MVRWWNGLVQSYGETSIVKWCIEYTPMFTWWNGDMIKWYGTNNIKVKLCNGETIILTFNSRWFLGPLQWWGTILLIHFIGWCITCWWKNRLWMMPRWLSKQPTRICNALWLCTPLLSSDLFLLFIIIFISPTTDNTGGGFPLWHLPVSCHFLLYLYCRYITSC